MRRVPGAPGHPNDHKYASRDLPLGKKCYMRLVQQQARAMDLSWPNTHLSPSNAMESAAGHCGYRELQTLACRKTNATPTPPTISKRHPRASYYVWDLIRRPSISLTWPAPARSVCRDIRSWFIALCAARLAISSILFCSTDDTPEPATCRTTTVVRHKAHTEVSLYVYGTSWPFQKRCSKPVRSK